MRLHLSFQLLYDFCREQCVQFYHDSLIGVIYRTDLGRASNIVTDTIKLLIEMSVNYYRSSLNFLNTNLFMQILFNLIAFRMIRGDKEFDIPFTNVTFSSDSLHFIVPVSLLALWLQFGFQFNNIIQLRSQTLQTVHESELLNNNEWKLINKLFEDSLLIDGWFFFHRKDHDLDFTGCGLLFFFHPHTIYC